MQLEALTPTIGAIIRDLDLRDILHDESLRAALHQKWLQHLVLFFPEQSLTHDEQLRLGELFGPLHIHPAAPYIADNPALMQIHTDAQSKRNNGEVWHSDVSADEEPPMASLLYLKQVPSAGGDTMWANMYAVLDSFSPAMQSYLAGLQALHVSDYSGYYGDHRPQRESPQALHPIVRTHPETGKQALYVNRGFTRSVIDLSSRESDALLQMLFARVEQPIFHCRFRWQENTVALWDNRCTQHMALWDYYPETRSGIRVTIAGEKPY